MIVNGNWRRLLTLRLKMILFLERDHLDFYFYIKDYEKPSKLKQLICF